MIVSKKTNLGTKSKLRYFVSTYQRSSVVVVKIIFIKNISKSVSIADFVLGLIFIGHSKVDSMGLSVFSELQCLCY